MGSAGSNHFDLHPGLQINGTYFPGGPCVQSACPVQGLAHLLISTGASTHGLEQTSEGVLRAGSACCELPSHSLISLRAG